MDIKTFIFLDCETTGLPNEERNTTKITELCLTAIQTNHLLLGKIPRIQNKLSLCFDPNKNIHPIASRLSDISNDLVEQQHVFDTKTVDILKNFISMQVQPVCFVAHNGIGFDYPILRAEIFNTGNELPEDILCADSLIAFKQLYYEDIKKNTMKKAVFRPKYSLPPTRKLKVTQKKGKTNGEGALQENNVNMDVLEETNGEAALQENNVNLDVLEDLETSREMMDIPDDDIMKALHAKENKIIVKQFCFKTARKPSFKLTQMYKVMTSKRPTNAHQAEYDVNMLIACAAVLNERFVNWANNNAKKFLDIQMIKPF